MRKERRLLLVMSPLILLIIFGLGISEEKYGYSPQLPVLSVSGTTALNTHDIVYINIYRYNNKCRFWELYAQAKTVVFRPQWASLNTFQTAFEVENGEYSIEIIECGGKQFYKLIEVRFSDVSVFIDTVKLNKSFT